MKKITNIKQRVFDSIRALGRPGTDAVIDYLEHSNFFRRGCYGHHKEFGGLAAHSIEVYDHMLAHAGAFPIDSITVIALFHDLGKTRHRDGRGHGRRSVDILDECGYPLSADERNAIGHHHHKPFNRIMCPILGILKDADCYSAKTWKNPYKTSPKSGVYMPRAK
ncbi:MAG: HD domain-containing protein [Bacteroidales bacterium]|nr:HD domain-containing protein [Bacteroidales bacterium]